MSKQADKIRRQCFQLLKEWLDSCTRKKAVSRNTIAVGIVAFHHLRRKCPVSKNDVLSDGGELKGSRAGLGDILEQYEVSRSYLKEATTRQAHQDAQRLLELFKWGRVLANLSDNERDSLLQELIDELAKKAQEWLNRSSLKLDVDREQSPAEWIRAILERAKGKSGGIVEQHLVGAKLERRYKNVAVSNYPAHAADTQTERQGDFVIQNAVYHVTATPSPAVVQKCVANIKAGKHPILLVPQDRRSVAIGMVELEKIDGRVSIIAIEDFLALNILELATDKETNFFQALQEIVETYNKRLAEVETDLSLQIQVR